MSRTIDERVVEMQFDNRQFEKNVATTMSTLDKFKAKLNFRGVGKGFEEIGAAAQKVDMRSLGDGIQEVNARFSALQVIGTTALVNITNSAMAAGKRIVSALTIDPVKTGFQEYETQMNAVQTILANTQSKGSTLDDVNKALEELNHYADLTIYNFTEMTRNIGTFTAAGIDLETSVSAIQGIANLAAVSGSTSQQASTAMYQLSQALASGTVKLMDWNSVVNAGMGGEVFQNALKKTSELLGTGAEAAIKAEGSFRESLTTGWLTSKVLTETLKKFTTSGANEYVAEYTGLSQEAIEASLKEAEAKYGEADAIEYASKALAEKSGKNQKEIQDALQLAKTAQDAATKVKTFSQLWDVMKEAAQSGWSKTWQLIIGDFQEAKDLLTPLADFFTNVIGKMSDARNNLLESALGKSFTDLAKKIDNFMEPAKKAADTVTKVTESVEDLGDIVDKVIVGKFGDGKERFDKLTESGQNYYKVQNKVNEKLGNSFRYTEEQIAAQDKLLESQGKLAKGTLEEAKATTELTDEKKDLLKELASMSEEQAKAKGYTDEQIKAFKELGDTAEKLGLPLDEFIDNLDQINGRWLLINSFKNVGKGLIATFNAIGKAWEEAFPSTAEERADRLFNVFATFHKVTRKFRDTLEGNVDEITRTFKGLFAALDIVTTVIGGPIKIAFKLLGQLLSVFHLDLFDVTASIGDVIVKFRDWLDSVLDFTGVFEKIAPYVTDFAKSIGKLVASFKNSTFVKKFSESFSKLLNTIKKFLKLDLTNLDFGGIVSRIKESLSSLPSEMKRIGQNIIEGLQNGIGDKFTTIVAKAREIANKIIETICDILGIHSPSTVMFEIGENIVQGLINGIGSGIKFIVDGVYKVGKTIIDYFKSLDFSPVADSLSSAFEKIKNAFSKIDWKKLLAIIPIGVALLFVKEIYDVTKALTEGMGGINDLIDGLGQIETNFAKVLKAKSFETMADGLKKIAEAVALLVGSVVVLTLVLNDENADKMYQAVAIIFILSVTLYALATAIRKMEAASAYIGKEGVKLSGFKTGLVTIGLAMLALAVTVKTLGEMDWEEAKNGLKTAALVAAGLLVFVGALRLLSIGGSAVALPAISASLTSIVVAIGLMAVVVKIAAKLTTEEIEKATEFISRFLLFVGILVTFTTIGTDKQIAKISGLLLSISVSMVLMVGVCKLAAKLTPDELTKATAFVARFLLFVGLLVTFTTISGNNKMAKVSGLLLSISVSMAIMIGVCKLAGKLTLDEVKAGIGFMAGFLVFVLLLTKITTISNEAKTAKIAATLIAMSIAVALLAGVAVLLSMLDTSAIANGVMAVVMLSLGMAAMAAAAKGAEKCVGNIVAFAIAIGVMAGAVAALTFVDQEKLLNATFAMGIMMGTFAIIMKVSQSMSSVTLTLLAMAVAVGTLGGVLYLVSTMPAEQSIPAAVALSVAMFAFAGAMRIVSGMQAPSAMALVAIGVMALVVGAIGGVLYLLQGLDPMQGIATVGVLSAFLAALLVAVFAMQLIHAPSLLGLAALAVVTLLVGALAGVLYLLQGVDPTQAIQIVGVISVFLVAMEAVCLAATAVGALAGLAIPGLLILVGFIGVLGLVVIGLASLAMDVIAGMPKLGSDLSAFMANVQGFVDGVQNIPDDISDKIGKLSTAILKLTGTEILDAIASFLSGGSSLADLGTELKTFGDGMAAFSASVGNIDAAVTAMSKIKDIQTAVEDVDLGALSTLAGDLKNYSTKASSLDIGAITMSIITAKQLMTLVNSMNGMDSTAIAKFNIAPLGQKMKAYSSNVSGINQSAITASINSVTRLRNFINSLTNLDSSGISGFKSAIDQLGTISISKVVEAFKGGTGQLTTAGADLMNAVIKGMKTAQGSISSAIRAIVEAMQNVLTGRKVAFTSAGTALASALNNGLKNKTSTLNATGKSMSSAAANGAREKYSSFYDAGSYMVDGFASGISTNAFKAAAKAEAMAQAALDAAKAILRENSPSKASKEIGEFFGQGFINGIDEYVKEAYGSSTNIAESARTGLNDAIGKIQSVLNNSADNQPTIRPVLDLSDIESGVNKLGGMFGDNASVGLTANISSISSAVNQRRQNGTTSDVISAISDLRKELSKMERPSYNINGITYDDGSNVADAVKTLVRAAKIERRV